MTTTQSALSLAVEAVNRSAEIVRTSQPGALTAKGDRDMASEVDLRIERETREFLTTAAPDIGFLGEENGRQGNRDLYWALDPVDGTANFVRGLPLCAVSLHPSTAARPVVGVIRLPFLGQLYTAERGQGLRGTTAGSASAGPPSCATPSSRSATTRSATAPRTRTAPASP